MTETRLTSFRNSLWGKVSLIVIISLLLMIPVSEVEDLIWERNRYSEDAKAEVSQTWSKSQSVGALVLSIPTMQQRTRKNKDGEQESYWYHSHLHILPDDLNITAETETVIRHRGLYRIPLYKTRLEITGGFSRLDEFAKDLVNTRVLWEQAELNLAIDEVRGLKELQVQWNDKPLTSTVGNMLSNICASAIKAALKQDPHTLREGKNRFHIALQLKGSESLNFLPFGETTVVKLKSNWGDPSFYGAFLPDQHEIQPEAFQAEWRILGINRNLPKHWTGKRSFKNNLNQARFGVKFLIPLETYQLNTRSVKYSFLFVALTFATLFFIEILLGLKFHPMHYVMTGAGLCLFYLLLLSISEHLGFVNAYMLASGATIISISLYIYGVAREKKGALTLFGQMSVLYAFLLVLLKMEDFALVAGASGLWGVLVFLMYVTRRIDWFNLKVVKNSEAARA